MAVAVLNSKSRKEEIERKRSDKIENIQNFKTHYQVLDTIWKELYKVAI